MIPFEIRSGTCFILYRCGDALQVRAARAGPGRNRGRAPGCPAAKHCPDMARIMVFAGLDDLAVTDFMHKGMPVVVNGRSEEHTHELQSLMRISYAVLRLKKKHTYELQIQMRN